MAAQPGARSIAESLTLRVWRVLVSPVFALVVLVFALLAVLLGVLLPQILGALRGDAYAWLQDARVGVAGGSQTPSGADIPLLLTSSFYRMALVMAAVLALLRLLASWVPAWRVPPFPVHVIEELDLPVNPEEGEAALQQALSASDLVAVHHAEYEGVRYRALQRAGVQGYAPALLYLGLLLLLVAPLVRWALGWRSPALNLLVGEQQPIGRSDLVVRVDSVQAERSTDNVAQVLLSVIEGEGAAAEEIELADGRGASHQGVNYYLVGTGPAVRVSARQVDGERLLLQGVTSDATPEEERRLSLGEPQQEQYLGIPSEDLLVRLVHYPSLPEQGIEGRALHVQVFQGSSGMLTTEDFLSESGTIESDSIVLDLAFENSSVLRAEAEPDLPLAALGAVSVVLGLLAHVLWPPRELWLAIWPASAAPDRVGSGLQIISAHQDDTAPWLQPILLALREMSHA